MIKIKTALLSVYDKSGIISLAETLIKNHVEILSSGGTANFLKENGIEVTEVSDYTGSPEMFGGRVKTLHPKIHAGILHDRENRAHKQQMFKQKFPPIDLIVVNFYPFQKVVMKSTNSKNIIDYFKILQLVCYILAAAALTFNFSFLVIYHNKYFSFSQRHGIELAELQKGAFSF